MPSPVIKWQNSVFCFVVNLLGKGASMQWNVWEVSQRTTCKSWELVFSFH